MHYSPFWQKHHLCIETSTINFLNDQINTTSEYFHAPVSTSPSSQTDTFILTDTQTNWTAIFSWQNGGKKSSMHMWEQQDLWPGRQGRGPGHSKAGRDLPNQQHSPTASEQAEEVQWLTGLLKGQRPQEAFTQLFFTPAWPTVTQLPHIRAGLQPSQGMGRGCWPCHTQHLKCTSWSPESHCPLILLSCSHHHLNCAPQMNSVVQIFKQDSFCICIAYQLADFLKANVTGATNINMKEFGPLMFMGTLGKYK